MSAAGGQLRDAEERSLQVVARLMLAEAARLDDLAGEGQESRVARAWERGAAHFLRVVAPWQAEE